jgi:hypothetical protein
MDGKKKAIFKVEDVIVSIACPHCLHKQQPKRYPNSIGWDFKDIRAVGTSRKISCQECKEEFALPVKLFNFLAGL